MHIQLPLEGAFIAVIIGDTGQCGTIIERKGGNPRFVEPVDRHMRGNGSTSAIADEKEAVVTLAERLDFRNDPICAAFFDFYILKNSGELFKKNGCHASNASIFCISSSRVTCR